MVDAAVFFVVAWPFLGFFGHCDPSLERPDIFSMNFGWGDFCCIALIPDHPSWFGLADGLM